VGQKDCLWIGRPISIFEKRRHQVYVKVNVCNTILFGAGKEGSVAFSEMSKNAILKAVSNIKDRI
jgi:hypothetical protein